MASGGTNTQTFIPKLALALACRCPEVCLSGYKQHRL